MQTGKTNQKAIVQTQMTPKRFIGKQQDDIDLVMGFSDYKSLTFY